MEVNLLNATGLDVANIALAKCYMNDPKEGTELLDKVINEYKHESVAEHINFSFELLNIPRFLLQQIARHRMMSITVESTRYTLKKKLKNESDFLLNDITLETDIKRAREYIYINFDVPLQFIKAQIRQLEEFRAFIVNDELTNDELKYLLPESWLSDMVVTMNLRSFINMYRLRSDAKALPEFRKLVNLMRVRLPNGYRSLIKGSSISFYETKRELSNVCD